MAKKRDKYDDLEKRRQQRRPTAQERRAMEKRNEDIRLRLKKSTDIANKIERSMGLPKTANVPSQMKADSMRGRTVEYGTRSMLQGLRSWITGGGGSRLTGR